MVLAAGFDEKGSSWIFL